VLELTSCSCSRIPLSHLRRRMALTIIDQKLAL